MHVGCSCFCVCVSVQKVSRKVDVWVPWCVNVILSLTSSMCHLFQLQDQLILTDYFSSSLSFVSLLSSFQRLPNGPSSGLEDSELERQREGEIERQRAELSQLRERLALMCRQVSVCFCVCVVVRTGDLGVRTFLQSEDVVTSSRGCFGVGVWRRG